MTFIERIDSLSSRFLSDRSYDLIVGPAIADLQHDAGTDGSAYCFAAVSPSSLPLPAPSSTS